MKSKSLLSSLRQFVILLTIIFATQPTAAIAAQSVTRAPGSILPGSAASVQNSTAAASGCQWTYYPISGGKLQPEQLLFNDPDNTPVTNLSLGSMFKGKSTLLASTGSTDFDGDNKTDVFRTIPRLDGNLQWQYSSGGTAAWVNMAYATSLLPVSQLGFGRIDSDAKTDVFASLYSSSLPGYQWMYSSGGVGSFIDMNSTSFYPDRLALGDFNGDGTTDVFTATAGSGTYNWAYSSAGSGPLIPLAYSSVDPSLLRFGDFNGDGKTDVFAATQAPDGSTQWLFSSGGAASYVNLASNTVPYSELQFGDFNGDGTTDVLAAEPQNDGSLQVVYWPGGLGTGVTLGTISAPAPALRVGDFNGDGTSDLMAIRCGMRGPLADGPIQTLAQSGYASFNNSLSGDVNGDGIPDVILVSTCQNPTTFGTCATHYLQIGAALGTAAKTFTLVAPQQLSNTLGFAYYKILTGDFNGDGKTDVALMYPGTSNLTIFVALSNGNGTFALQPPQIFGGTWNTYNPIAGNFSGDNRTDLAFATVCNLSSNSCSVGDNNSLVVATASGAAIFTMGAQQNLGASGWEDYYVYAGDFNGDGKTDLVFNSTCQKTNFIDSTCTIGDNNIVFTALSNGLGSFTMGAEQNYSSGWSDYPSSIDLVGDINGDGRADLVLSSPYQSVASTYNKLVVVGLANPDGTFGLGSIQNFGSAWTGSLSLADLNRDGKADLLWDLLPLSDTDVDTYAVATSNGNGTFKNLGQGSIYTGLGYFQVPETNWTGKIATGLTIVSTRQDSISNALFISNDSLQGTTIYLPFLKK